MVELLHGRHCSLMRTAHLFGPWPLFVGLVIGALAFIGAYAFGPFSYLLAGSLAGVASVMVVRESEKEYLTRANHDEAERDWSRRDYLRGWRCAGRSVGFPELMRDALAWQGGFAVLALLAWKIGPFL